MCNENNKNTNCLCELLNTILKLQKHSQCIDDISSSCDKPFLGPCSNNGCYNTRPITLYSCRNSSLWTMPYTLNDEPGTSTVFRIESLNCSCATFRVLAPNPDTTSIYPYVATDSFFTINLNCVSCIQCLPDTFISCI